MLALHGLPQLVRVEVAIAERDDAGADEQRLERREGTRSVHEGRRGEMHAVGAGIDDLARERARGGGVLGSGLADKGIGAVGEHVHEVLVAPHDTLRHARGAARVQEVEVVARPLDPRSGIVLREELLVRDREVAKGRAVVDLDPQLDARGAIADLLDLLAEVTVEQQRLGVGVVEEVGELVLEVPVVHVRGNGAQLERRIDALAVLVAVVEVRGDLRVLSEPGGRQRRRETRGPIVELAPGHAPVALHERDAFGEHVRDRFPHVGEVPGHLEHPPPERSSRTARR